MPKGADVITYYIVSSCWASSRVRQCLKEDDCKVRLHNAVSVGVDADCYVDVGVDGNVVLSVQSFRFIILKVR